MKMSIYAKKTVAILFCGESGLVSVVSVWFCNPWMVEGARMAFGGMIVAEVLYAVANSMAVEMVANDISAVYEKDPDTGDLDGVPYIMRRCTRCSVLILGISTLIWFGLWCRTTYVDVYNGETLLKSFFKIGLAVVICIVSNVFLSEVTCAVYNKEVRKARESGESWIKGE